MLNEDYILKVSRISMTRLDKSSCHFATERNKPVDKTEFYLMIFLKYVFKLE